MLAIWKEGLKEPWHKLEHPMGHPHNCLCSLITRSIKSVHPLALPHRLGLAIYNIYVRCICIVLASGEFSSNQLWHKESGPICLLAEQYTYTLG